MTRRLLVSYAAFAVVVLLLLEVPLAVLGARRYRSTAVDQAEKVAVALSVAATTDFEAHDLIALRSIAERYRAQTDGEVAIVDGAGVPVASVDPDHDDDAQTTDRSAVVTALGGTVAGIVVSDEGEADVVGAAPIGDGERDGGGAVVVSLPGAPTDHRIHVFWAVLGGFAVAVLGAALLLGWWLARTVTRPLARLGLAVQAFAGPDLAVRAGEDQGPPEVVALARQFNAMADQIRRLVDAQSRFVADASHQLRSPLAALRLRIDNLQAGGPGPATADAATLRALDAELQRLSRLVDGLIDLGNAETTTPRPTPVALDQVARERVEVWSALAAERGVALELDGADPHTAPVAEGDLDQIVDNLLDNALEVSPPGSHVTVSVAGREGGGAVLSVADEGPGMTDDQLAQAFERFWRAQPRPGSTGGLGLAIVRQLADRNALEVTLARRPGGGILATVVAPRARRRAAPRAISGRP